MIDNNALNKYKETILKDYPKLSLEDTFNFKCYKGIACFNKCCRDVNIFLTPYDVLRLRKGLNMGSEEFLKKYTDTLILDKKNIPAVILKMDKDNDLRCPLVSDEGCSVYDNRPWACRMYPVGMAQPNNDYTAKSEFYFITEEEMPFCEGLKENNEWTIKKWKEDQGSDEYDLKSETYKRIILHDFFLKNNGLTEQKTSMFYMASYNLDAFRTFVFESSFLDKFDVEEKLKDQMKSDDEALLFFGFRWLRFSIFGEQTIKINGEVVNNLKNELEAVDEQS